MLICWQQSPSREEIISQARGYGMVFREEVLSLKDEPMVGVDSSRPPDAKVTAIEAEELMVTIPNGAVLEEISLLLEGQGIIGAAEFEAEAHRRGIEHKIKAGSYYLPKDDVGEIISRLTGGGG